VPYQNYPPPLDMDKMVKLFVERARSGSGEASRAVTRAVLAIGLQTVIEARDRDWIEKRDRTTRALTCPVCRREFSPEHHRGKIPKYCQKCRAEGRDRKARRAEYTRPPRRRSAGA